MSRYAKEKSKVKAEVRAELMRLAKAEDGIGGLRSSDVVEAARSKDSPLHGEFEWNNSKAGHEFRLIQARTLIRAAVTTAMGDDGKPKVVDRFIHVPAVQAEQPDSKTREGVYMLMSDVVKDDDKFARALSALVAIVNRAKQSAQELRDAAAGSSDADRMVRIGMAITALETAGAAVAALH